MAWHGQYDKYGFTKRVGEEMCEYYRRNHGIAYVSVRPHDFTPWGSDYLNRYGARLLYGGVDREDVLDCVQLAVAHLEAARDAPAGVVVNALRPNSFVESQIANWEADPVSVCEAVFPGAREMVEKYTISIAHRPSVLDIGPGAAEIGYAPTRHFGKFLDELRSLDAQGGPALVAKQQCPY
jgi:nucleoside-diphosphate-sugar epimerase